MKTLNQIFATAYGLVFVAAIAASPYFYNFDYLQKPHLRQNFITDLVLGGLFLFVVLVSFFLHVGHAKKKSLTRVHRVFLGATFLNFTLAFFAGLVFLGGGEAGGLAALIPLFLAVPVWAVCLVLGTVSLVSKDEVS